jgi:histone-lysine N-methyltransferase SETMAR
MKYLQFFLWLILNVPFGTAAVLLQYDAKHTCLKTREAITALGWTVLPHPLYSPDLAPSVFHLFGTLKDAIRGKRFGIDDEVNEKVKKWLLLQKSNWYKNALVARWSIAVEMDGDCVEN